VSSGEGGASLAGYHHGSSVSQAAGNDLCELWSYREPVCIGVATPDAMAERCRGGLTAVFESGANRRRGTEENVKVQWKLRHAQENSGPWLCISRAPRARNKIRHMSETGPDPRSSMTDSDGERPSERGGLFRPAAAERAGLPVAAWLIAGAVVLLALGGLAIGTHHAPKPAQNVLQPLDPYAASLAISGIQMSESASLSAVKVTYIDGKIRNMGAKPVSNATIQVLFANDEQLPPQVETVPLTVIRTREPYIDTEPLSAAPLKPGDEREFRLIFENIGANWNQQLPQIRPIHVE
jgi:hypothetical protein